MNILFMSVHEVLEYLELSLLTELGHNVFSIGGAYQNGPTATGILRPAIPSLYFDDQLIRLALQCSRDYLHPDLIAWADTIICMHRYEWIINNWENIKHKTVILRTIGQNIQKDEEALTSLVKEGLRIVRYSPKEKEIPSFAGEDAMIRFYADPEEFKGWTGEERKVITFAQSMRKRGDHLNFTAFDKSTKLLPRALYGPDNEDSGITGGVLDYESMKLALRKAGCYFYGGTQPASYTLAFIEAYLTGTPIVAVGPKLANVIYAQATYEVPELIEQGKEGFWSDSI